jgi:hypothetical protein
MTAIWKLREVLPNKLWERIPKETTIKNLDLYLAELRLAGRAWESAKRVAAAAKARREQTGEEPRKREHETTQKNGNGNGRSNRSEPRRNGRDRTRKPPTTAPPSSSKPQSTRPANDKLGEPGSAAAGKGWEDAHSGISKEETQKRKEKSACTLCGTPKAADQKWPHSWRKCTGPKRTTGGPYARTSAASSRNKPKRKDRKPLPTQESQRPNGASTTKATASYAGRVQLADESSSDEGEDGETYGLRRDRTSHFR